MRLTLTAAGQGHGSRPLLREDAYMADQVQPFNVAHIQALSWAAALQPQLQSTDSSPQDAVASKEPRSCWDTVGHAQPTDNSHQGAATSKQPLFEGLRGAEQDQSATSSKIEPQHSRIMPRPPVEEPLLGSSEESPP